VSIRHLVREHADGGTDRPAGLAAQYGMNVNGIPVENLPAAELLSEILASCLTGFATSRRA